MAGRSTNHTLGVAVAHPVIPATATPMVPGLASDLDFYLKDHGTCYGLGCRAKGVITRATMLYAKHLLH